MTHILDLPKELLFHILDCVPIDSWNSTFRSCRHFYQFHSQIWKKVTTLEINASSYTDEPPSSVLLAGPNFRHYITNQLELFLPFRIQEMWKCLPGLTSVAILTVPREQACFPLVDHSTFYSIIEKLVFCQNHSFRHLTSISILPCVPLGFPGVNTVQCVRELFHLSRGALTEIRFSDHGETTEYILSEVGFNPNLTKLVLHLRYPPTNLANILHNYALTELGLTSETDYGHMMAANSIHILATVLANLQVTPHFTLNLYRNWKITSEVFTVLRQFSSTYYPFLGNLHRLTFGSDSAHDQPHPHLLSIFPNLKEVHNIEIDIDLVSYVVALLQNLHSHDMILLVSEPATATTYSFTRFIQGYFAFQRKLVETNRDTEIQFEILSGSLVTPFSLPVVIDFQSTNGYIRLRIPRRF